MKAVVINGSPHTDRGNTALILEPFLEGMREAGAETDVFYTKKLTIHPCQGEYHCWFKRPGECFQQDDMHMLLPLIESADILVFATPVYVDGVTGPMKNLLDRMIPIGRPFIELREGHCRHPARRSVDDGKLVLVSNCGFWELDNFDPVIVHMRAVSSNLDRRFAGALIRPHGGALRAMKEHGAPVDDIFRAAREAGRQLVRSGLISEDLLRIVSRELLPRDVYVRIANERVREALENLGTA